MIVKIKEMEFDIMPMSAYDSIGLLARLVRIAAPLLKGIKESKSPLEMMMNLQLQPNELQELCQTIVSNVHYNRVPVDLKGVNLRGKLDIVAELCYEVLKGEYTDFLAGLGVDLTEAEAEVKS